MMRSRIASADEFEISHELWPSVDGKLAGDDQRAGIVAIFHDDLQQIALLLEVATGSGFQSSRMSRSTRPSDASTWCNDHHHCPRRPAG